MSGGNLTRERKYMSVCTSNLKRAERVLFVTGLLLIGMAAFIYLSGKVYSNLAVARFRASAQSPHQDAQSAARTGSRVDFSLWSPKRVEAYKAALAQNLDRPLALLHVGRIHLEVPVFEGTSATVLNRGVGRIAGTARIGDAGNMGIAGHRDGFFRRLKDVRVGDAIELQARATTRTYVIDWIEVVDPQDVSVLKTGTSPALTLVTCFPFYFIGSAPQRYIVHAFLKSQTATPGDPKQASLQATVTRTKENPQ